MKNKEKEIDIEEVELAERYADALERIKEIKKSICFDECDVNNAEKYVALLNTIDELDQAFTEDDLSEAKEYLSVLNAINDTDVQFTDDDIIEAEKYLRTLIAINENEE